MVRDAVVARDAVVVVVVSVAYLGTVNGSTYTFFAIALPLSPSLPLSLCGVVSIKFYRRNHLLVARRVEPVSFA